MTPLSTARCLSQPFWVSRRLFRLLSVLLSAALGLSTASLDRSPSLDASFSLSLAITMVSQCLSQSLSVSRCLYRSLSASPWLPPWSLGPSMAKSDFFVLSMAASPAFIVSWHLHGQSRISRYLSPFLGISRSPHGCLPDISTCLAGFVLLFYLILLDLE